MSVRVGASGSRDLGHRDALAAAEAGGVPACGARTCRALQEGMLRLSGALLVMCLLGCGPARQQSAFFSFEASLQGWSAQGLDLVDGNADEPWIIRPTFDRGFDGPGCAKLFLDNGNGTGKIWLERTFLLEPGRRYRAHLEMALGTQDGTANAFRLIAGFLPAPPRTDDALGGVASADTSTGGATGFAWVGKSSDAEVSGPAVTAVIGVWGTSASARTYYLDAVTVLFTEEP